MKIKNIFRIIPHKYSENRKYIHMYRKYSFRDYKYSNYEQFEAQITRMYHSIEKGLAYEENFKVGFGKKDIERLIDALNEYAKKGYDVEAFFYKTALSVLKEYIKKNEEEGFFDTGLKDRIDSLAGDNNDYGGIIAKHILSDEEIQQLNFEQIMKERHSVRHFSEKEVEVEKIIQAISLAQYTPSACNRQGWSVRIVKNNNIKQEILKNQNGNRGFGDEIDKLLIITADLNYYNRDRETYQAWIDGGMFSESVINALFFVGLATVPLSASLSDEQEERVRLCAEIKDYEIIIMFIGVGNCLDKYLTTKSTRRPPRYKIL